MRVPSKPSEFVSKLRGRSIRPSFAHVRRRESSIVIESSGGRMLLPLLCETDSTHPEAFAMRDAQSLPARGAEVDVPLSEGARQGPAIDERERRGAMRTKRRLVGFLFARDHVILLTVLGEVFRIIRRSPAGDLFSGSPRRGAPAPVKTAGDQKTGDMPSYRLSWNGMRICPLFPSLLPASVSAR